MPPATTAPSPASLPLDGVLVADFSRVLAGPLATMTPVSYTHLTLPTNREV